MRAFFKYGMSILLILVTLLSTLQISVYKMECLMSGKTVVSLSDFKRCSSSDNGICALSEKCCRFHEMVLNFDFEAKNEAKTFSYNSFFLKHYESNFSPTRRIINKVRLYTFSDSSPPYGIDLLKAIQVFRL